MRRIGYCISANVWIDQLRRWELDLLPSGSKPGVQVQLGEKSLLSKSEELKAVSIAASTVFVPKLSRDSHRTTIIIAHRLSTIRAANEILVMRDGRIVERGAHHDLVVIGEFFAELIGHQSAGAVGIAISAAC